MRTVTASVSRTVIPTYPIGEPNKNPMFLEKRVYQGSTGKVYPYPVVDRIFDEKTDQEYTAVYLENDYLLVMILPELGGRIQRALDKTNGYDFVYYNHVIKPALVGLTGPWISGGIEFNWPQHHRPDTYLPVPFTLKEYPDGSRSVLLGDVDRINGTRGITEIRLYPDKAYIEIRGQLYNPTSLPQTFLWWANPAVSVNDQTQSVFPPDVHAVMDHGKRDVSRFPIATGVYYKHDYSEGVDISRYKNIPVPTSYMAAGSDFNFVGGYDYGREAGLLHVADHHISPGKKQWTWGNGDFGRAWDRNLTDEDGPYIELMTGVYTDNQPDFTWLKPFEEKTFTQYFMPYKNIGYVKNASTEAAVNLEIEEKENAAAARVRVYVTSEFEDLCIRLLGEDRRVLLEEHASLSPETTFEAWSVPLSAAEVKEPSLLKLSVFSGDRLLISYRPLKEEPHSLPEPAAPAPAPEEIMTNEELLMTGLHIEQYRHATFLPDPYYLEGLKRDPRDTRICNAYASLLLRRGLFADAVKTAEACLPRLFLKNPNPYTGEPLYTLGLALYHQGRLKEAFDRFYKAAWSAEQQEKAFYYMAVIACTQKEYEEALGYVDRSLVRNSHNIRARGLKAGILKALGRKKEFLAQAEKNLGLDPFDLTTRLLLHAAGQEWQDAGREARESLSERILSLAENAVLLPGLALSGAQEEDLRTLGCLTDQKLLPSVLELTEAGFTDEALAALSLCPDRTPMRFYTEAYIRLLTGDREKACELVAAGEAAGPGCTFPNALEEMKLLEAVTALQDAPKALYYLGCLYYDKRRYEDAGRVWERSASLDDSFPTVRRNLALLYYNKRGDSDAALRELTAAFSLDPSDARVFMELDQLRKKLGRSPEERLSDFEAGRELIDLREDLKAEYAALLNMNGRFEEAMEFISSRRFHPWEGGEGKISLQYTIALQQLARRELAAGNADKAAALLEKALVYPENLGEGKLEGTRSNDIYYLLGTALEKAGKPEAAREAFRMACLGTSDPAGVMYYNDQPADMILYQGLAFQKLGDHHEAMVRFHKLMDYSETHMNDEVKIDYFAVSLPDLQIFEDDLTLRGRLHCLFLKGLGLVGLGKTEAAAECFALVTARDPSHQKAALFLSLCRDSEGARHG